MGDARRFRVVDGTKALMRCPVPNPDSVYKGISRCAALGVRTMWEAQRSGEGLVMDKNTVEAVMSPNVYGGVMVEW